MSAPVREPDDNESLNDRPLNYAPKRARQAEHDQNPESLAPKVNTAPRPHMLEPPEPPWKRKKQRGVFAGDVAIVELRTQRPTGFRSRRCQIRLPGYLAGWGGS